MPEQNTSEKKPYIAMYDVRGIQGYIYKTNKLKEIIAASLIVENIFEESLNVILEKLKDKEKVISSYSTEWEGKEYHESKTGSAVYDAEVLFIGGGNAFVLYSSKELCGMVNRMLARRILDETYSMQLACAAKEKSNDYYDDYKKLMQKMGEVKSKMPMAHTFHALPIIQTERETGYPVVDRLAERYDGKEQIKLLSEESRLKREAAKKYEKEMNDNGKTVNTEKIFDNMVTEKGKNSFLAVVHIDGNSMGKNIAKLMRKDSCPENKNFYEYAVAKMREISSNINCSFKKVYDQMEAWAIEHTVLENGQIPIRKIICAGDDITFVCNGSMALDCVEYFLSHITKEVMYEDEKTKGSEAGKQKNLDQFGFSACAGIAYFKSHYPFSDAYETAEECCSIAKKRAKSMQRTVPVKTDPESNSEQHTVPVETGQESNRKIGNWVDFQICLHIAARNLKKNRKKNYQIFDGTRLERRPYYIPFYPETSIPGDREELDKLNEAFNFSIFKGHYRYFQDREKIPSGLAKNIRDTYSYGKKEIKGLVQFAKSRTIELPGDPYIKDPDIDIEDETVASWYDALELQDLYADIYKRGETEEGTQDGKTMD